MESAVLALADAGFDLVHRFDANAAAREPGLERLAGDQRLGLLVGNTRALWTRFVAAMNDRLPAGDPALAARAEPLEHYTETMIDAAFPAARIYYGHRLYDGEFLPLQRLAVATGLGALAASHLVIHPIYGPWFALRAVILVDGEPVAHAPIAKPCACNPACDAALSRALDPKAPGDWRAWLAVRDACTLRAWRYSDEQIHYHYTKLWDDP